MKNGLKRETSRLFISIPTGSCQPCLEKLSRIGRLSSQRDALEAALQKAQKQLKEKVNHNFSCFLWNQFISSSLVVKMSYSFVCGWPAPPLPVSLMPYPLIRLLWLKIELQKSGFARKLLQKLDKPVIHGENWIEKRSLSPDMFKIWIWPTF